MIARALRAGFPDTPMIGCTTAGEFTEKETGSGGVSVFAMPRRMTRGVSAALADLSKGVERGVRAAGEVLERRIGTPLREADPERFVGLVLIDGTHGEEEKVNEALGDIAPQLSFVGGSAGDDLAFDRTRVFCDTASSDHGAALMLLDLVVPFVFVTTCSFESTGRAFVATEVDAAERIVWEFDDLPAAEVYAQAVGCPIAELGPQVFMAHPVGLMIEDRPWIRSPQQVVEGRGIKFYCHVLKGMRVDLMSATRMVDDTAAAIGEAAEHLGGPPSGAIMFNCILRRLEMDVARTHADFLRAIQGIPTAGFHTYGESWLGHMNQTLTAVMFG